MEAGAAPETAAMDPARQVDAAAPETAPESADGGGDAIESLDELKEAMESLKDQLMRRTAEFQNYRRRTDQEKAFMLEIGKAQVLQPLLEVLDDFERSLAATSQAEEQTEEAPGAAYQALKQGVDLVYRKFMEHLERLGVEPIAADGQPFDEALHEAVMQQTAPEGTPAGTVLQELQRGYRMGDRVLRHAKVIVAA